MYSSPPIASDDGGGTWQPIGLAGRLIMSVAASSAERDVGWAGTEPSEVCYQESIDREADRRV